MAQLELIQVTKKKKRNIEVVRFGGKSPLSEGEKVKHFRELIEESEDLYPGIDRWLARKVLPELKTRSWRSALVLYDEGFPAAVAVMRHGTDAKLCNMRVRREYQDMGLGELLIKLVIAEMRTYQVKDIHFTLPSHLWEGDMGVFLREYGFEFQGLAEVQYRQRKNKMGLLFNDDPEFACSAPFAVVWNNMRKKISEGFENFTLNGRLGDLDLLMSIRPKFAHEIIKGEKRIELRRRFSEKWRGAKAVIYSTDPVRSLVGEVTVENIITDTPESIWEKWHVELGCTFEEFKEYSKGTTKIHAIRLGHVVPYVVPIPISQLEFHANFDLPIPQSYFNLRNQEKWHSALKWGALVNANR